MTVTDVKTEGKADVKTGDDKEPEGKPLEDSQFVSKHAVTIAGQRIDYTTKTGRLVMYDDSEVHKPRVALFYTAYFRDGVESTKDRPLVFLWNGGPGSSAIWLHMFSLGPRRVLFENDPLLDTSRWELGENEHSLLDVADLVFVDPPSTGYSRVAPSVDPEEYHGVDPDAAVIGDFVVEFTSRERRGHSPVVLLGESYGTLRTPAVADYLQGLPGFFVDGVVLVSSLLDVAGATFGVGTTLGAVGLLPSYAATALYHGVLQGDLPSLLAEAEDFALHDYSVALLKGSRLSDNELDSVAKRMGELTGLSPELCRRSDLRVTLWRYTKALLRDQRRTVGRLDTRWVGIDVDSVGETFEDDPSMSRIWGPPRGPSTATCATTSATRSSPACPTAASAAARSGRAAPARRWASGRHSWRPRPSSAAP